MFLFASTILFICSLFNDAVSKFRHTVSKDQMAANKEMERRWKQVVVAYFKVLSSHLTRGTEENQKNFMSVRVWAEMQPCTSLIQVRRVLPCVKLIISSRSHLGNRRFPHKRNLNAHFDSPMLSLWTLTRNTRVRLHLYLFSRAIAVGAICLL